MNDAEKAQELLESIEEFSTALANKAVADGRPADDSTAGFYEYKRVSKAKERLLVILEQVTFKD